MSGDGEPAMAHIHHQSGEQLAQRGGGDGVARPPPCSIPYFFLPIHLSLTQGVGHLWFRGKRGVGRP